MNRRHFLFTSTAVLASAVSTARAAKPPALPELIVYKSPTCGCCGQWVEHLQRAGFTAKVVDTEDMAAVKRRFGVPEDAASCHTAVVAGYFVEGHVPAADIKRLLAERPAGQGIAAPGMPMGSPGMEMGDHRQPYDVLLISRTRTSRVFAHHP